MIDDVITLRYTILLDTPTQQLIADAKQILAGDEITLDKIAISVFEDWVGPDGLHKLNCADDAERLHRDKLHLSYWLAIRQTWPDLLALRPHDEFTPPHDLEAYTNACRIEQDEGSDHFQCIVIPSLNAIYYENWEDTNVLWFRDRTDIRDMLDLARKNGLYPIEYA